ncbi:hypothetical protein DPMN_060919 [Dreissena polymorpha]|uniref:Uncharacterized protein n=1 Tax=Dreissena polymorpha TaxID=45954 RepID=A0A9D4C6H3_DREPO|nr:hypothetical protein DPMN_060919 [Dreissena polymorpha]
MQRVNFFLFPQKLKRSYLFSEVLRGCYMGLVDLKQADSQEDYRWCAFTYLKASVAAFYWVYI